MRLGISSYTYSWACGMPHLGVPRSITHADLLQRAAELGVGVVQVCDNLPLDALTVTETRQLVALAAGLDLQIEVGTRGLSPDNLRTHLHLCEMFGSPILRVVVDTATDHPSPDALVQRLTAATGDLDAAGVTLAVENHDRFKARTLSGILERVASERVGICLDTVNSFGALEGPEIVVGALGPWVVNLHVKDFTVRRVPSNLGFVVEGRPAGEGMLDVPWVLDTLDALGRDPNAILELWTPPEDALEATLRKEDDWARQSVHFLRGLIPA